MTNSKDVWQDAQLKPLEMYIYQKMILKSQTNSYILYLYTTVSLSVVLGISDLIRAFIFRHMNSKV